MFQSTFPRGERLYFRFSTPQTCRVSIYVPTRGTTRQIRSCTTTWKCFNPRSHEGNDATASEINQIEVQSFNPRSHEGNDASCFFFSSADCESFNPRSHEGNDADQSRIRSGKTGVSIHVPTRGTTPACHGYRICFFTVSIHVPTRGTTPLPWKEQREILMFQSTFPRGERRLSQYAL